MKQYYYLTGKVQNGPFNIDELKKFNLPADTLIWTEGMENWEKIKENSELSKTLGARQMPPPIPIETETSSNIKQNEVSILKPTKRQLSSYLIWVCTHITIFLLTKTKTDFFQDYLDRPERFWPFTSEFLSEKTNHPDLTYNCQTADGRPCFHGIFADYDLSEL